MSTLLLLVNVNSTTIGECQLFYYWLISNLLPASVVNHRLKVIELTDMRLVSVSSVRPEFRSPLKSLVEMTEGESRSMNLSADANPVPVNYRLSRNGTSLSLPGDLPRFQLTKQGILTITQLRREDSGNYTVKAENSRGSGVLNFTIVVKCESFVFLPAFLCQ